MIFGTAIGEAAELLVLQCHVPIPAVYRSGRHSTVVW